MMKKLLSVCFLYVLVISLAVARASGGTKVILLGTGTPNPDPAHSGPAVVILTGGIPYLFDSGAGVVRQAAGVSAEWGGDFPGMNIKNLRVAFLTHLHSDHTVGLADLILTPWVMGRDRPLELYGPEGTEHMAKHILKAYEEDIRYRIYGAQPANDSGWRVNIHEIREGRIYRDDHITVTAFPVVHGTWPNALGYRVETDDKVIVISGDTRPCESLLKYGRNADILIHEVYSVKGFREKDAFWQKYHAAGHTSAFELAEIADKLRPRKLVLYHILFWGATPEEILMEIHRNYNGDVIVGDDGMVVE